MDVSQIEYYLISAISLGQLIKIIREPQLDLVVDELIDFSGGSDDELRDIATLGQPTMLKAYVEFIWHDYPF